jgi:carbamoyltransferase
MMILGLNAFFDGPSACLVRDGQLLVAIEEERVLQRRCRAQFPAKAIERCFKEAQVDPREIDMIAVSAESLVHHAESAWFGGRKLRDGPPMLRDLYGEAKVRIDVERFQRNGLPGLSGWATDRPRLVFVPRESCLAPGSFLISPFDSAALLSIDGSHTAKGDGRKIERCSESHAPHSLALLSSALAQFLGFGADQHERAGEIAAQGDPKAFQSTVESVVQTHDDLTIEIDLGAFDRPSSKAPAFSKHLLALFGHPRKAGAPFSQTHKDVAAAVQAVLESTAIALCQGLRTLTKERALVVAGDLALNRALIVRIARDSGFDELFVPPAPHDGATSLGAAYYLQHVELGLPREFVLIDPFVGTSSPDPEIERALAQAGLTAKPVEDAAQAGVELLKQGLVIGWYQGRTELGPRPLGHRSILADPTNASVKDKLRRVLHQNGEERPLGCAVTVERTQAYFETKTEHPFMSEAVRIRPDKREALALISHVDGTARPKTVRADQDGLFHRLIASLGKQTGTPVVLNAPFSAGPEEPSVDSPGDALRCFQASHLDALILGRFLVRK